MKEPAWKSESRNIIAVALGETSSVCLMEAYAVKEDPILPAAYRYDVRHWARYPADMTFTELAEDIRLMMTQKPLTPECDLVVDQTVVGPDVAELFRKASTRLIRVTIMGTGTETTQVGTAKYTVPLTALLSTLRARLHCGELKLPKEFTGAVDLEASLKDLSDQVSEQLREGNNLIRAVAVGLWRASMKKPKFGSRRKPEVHLGYADIKRRRWRRRV